MKIDDAIKALEEAKAKGVKNIIIATWEAEGFDKKDDEAWEAICDLVESEMDWGDTHDAIADLIDSSN